MTHLTPAILARSWKGSLADLLEALSDLEADQTLDVFNLQGEIQVVVTPCARYFKEGKRLPLARALLYRDRESGRKS
jgi:hypothetical protein